MYFCTRKTNKNKNMIKLFYTSNASNPSAEKVLGVCKTIEEAAEEAFEEACDQGERYECDNIDDIRDALKSRGYYQFGYGSCRARIENVEG